MAARFGIHVGNTSACLAIWKDEDRVEVVANDAGDRVTPTIVQWTPYNTVVGRAAQLEHFKNETNTVIRNKQLLSDNISESQFEEFRSCLPYVLHRIDKFSKYEILYEGKQHHVSPWEISEVIFKKIYMIAQAAVGGNKELNAVICAPLHFSLKTVELMKDVVKKVGFNVLQVIDEPSSAALAAGLGCNVEESSYHCLIYRVGGVTLDATVLLIQNGLISVLNTIHKHNVGGMLLTEKLAEFLVSEFKRQYRSAELTERSKYKLNAAAENVKQILSIQNLAQCSAESVGGGCDLNCSVSRARFENMIAPCLPQLIDPVKEVVKKSSLSIDQIKKVILCGGTLKIPKLQESVQNIFPQAEVIVSSNPDEDISIGAAMQAGFTSKYQISPEDLGIEAPCLTAAIRIEVTSAESEPPVSFSVPENSFLPLRMHFEANTVGKSVSVNLTIIRNTVVNLGSVKLDELEPVSFISLDLDINKEGILSLTIGNEPSCKKNHFKYNLNEMNSL